MNITKNNLEDPIIKGFFKEDDNWKIYKEYSNNPTESLKQELNEHFERYYFRIRAFSYLAK